LRPEQHCSCGGISAAHQEELGGISAGGISVIGVRARNNERGDFLVTTTPAVPETESPSTERRVLPHFVQGGGYTTQFILFSRNRFQATGALKYFSQNGIAIPLVFD
jgi:hypothetical protein